MKFAILGDFILSEEFRINDILIDILLDTDFNIANMEAPFITDDLKPANGKYGLFNLENNCSLLKHLNIKVVSLANNHITDFGREGINYTIKKLEKEGIKYFGVGNNIEKALKPAVISVNSKSISCYGFQTRYLTKYHADRDNFGTADINVKNFAKAVSNDKSDHRLFFMHWNQEFEDYPEPLFKHLAEKALDYADIVCGSHSHCMQGYQLYNKKLIFHSLGNFSLPHTNYYNYYLKKYREKCYQSFFPVIEIVNDLIRFEIYPYQIEKNGTRVFYPKHDNRIDITNKLNEISIPLKLEYKKYKKFYNKNKIRKSKMTLTKNHTFNLLMHSLRKLFIKSFRNSEKVTVLFLKKLKLYCFFKKTFKPLIDKIHRLL